MKYLFVCYSREVMHDVIRKHKLDYHNCVFLDHLRHVIGRNSTSAKCIVVPGYEFNNVDYNALFDEMRLRDIPITTLTDTKVFDNTCTFVNEPSVASSDISVQ